MAEWTGRKRTLNSVEPEGDPPQFSAPHRLASTPEAPGAVKSPQIPGLTPDDPDLPGLSRGSLPPLGNNRRPLTEYGSAQRLLRMFTPAAGAVLTPADWEQGAASNEELRKADPALETPFRPLPGFGLGLGRSTPAITTEALKALGDAAEVTQPITGHEMETTRQQAAAPASDVPAGAVAGAGAGDCPPEFPVKGNAQSRIFHTPESRVYGQTIAEFCFSTPEAAIAAGFQPPKSA